MLNLFHKTLKPLKETCLLPTKIEVKSEPKVSFVITSLTFGFKQFCPSFFKLNKIMSLVGNYEILYRNRVVLCCGLVLQGDGISTEEGKTLRVSACLHQEVLILSLCVRFVTLYVSTVR